MGEGNAAMQSGGRLPEPGERDIEDSKIYSAVSVVHPQNVRFQNVRFRNVWFQNV
jgi:hypothetical protein